MKKRFLSLLMALVLLIGTMSTSVFAADNDEVITSLQATANLTLSELKDSTITLNSYKNILLIALSRVDCTEQINEYLGLVKDNMTEGKLTSSYDSPAYYAVALLMMALSDTDATNFNSTNFVDTFVNSVKSYDMTSLNPYLFVYLTGAAMTYKNKMSTSDYEAVLNAVEVGAASYYVSDDDASAFNYWGFSTDTCSLILSSLINATESGIKEKMNNSIDFLLLQETVTGQFAYSTVGSWGSTTTNGDSTGLALLYASTMNSKELADRTYTGLQSFASPSTPGGYGYKNTTYNKGATLDALMGLASYASSYVWPKAYGSTGYLFDLYNLVETTDEATTTEVATEDSNVEVTTVAEATTTVEATTGAETATQTGDINTSVLLVLGIVSLIAISITVAKRKEA